MSPTGPTRRSRGRHRRRRGLRVRVITLFALGGLALSLLLSVITYTLADRYLVTQRERSATRQTYLNARALRDELLGPTSEAGAALTGLELPRARDAVLEQDGKWFSTSVAVGQGSVPPELRALVRSGTPGHQRIKLAGDPLLVVGLPIPAVRGEYFELFSLSELDSTLDVIRRALIGAAAATTLLAALLGFWASRRVLRPLTVVGGTAAEIADGDLSLRLEDQGDPDLRELTESFNRMVDALQARIERDARFASSVSHELRSPLTTLATASELIEQREDELTPRTREAFRVLLSDVRRFRRLVEQLLELGRAEADVDELVIEPVRLGELVLHSATLIPGPSFTIEMDPDVTDDPVLTDKRRLERVLANLLDNARIHGNGVAAVSLVAHGDRLRISIDDRGEGVDAAERERVFERFYRGAAAGRRNDESGTGLGLALVTEHMRILGGTVWIEDVPDAPGARFVVDLPWRPA